ncbi:L,D-transpeptidase [Actinocrispum sp. NPDC049592]|uniref:L,D-transpeptidase n=1 Tax=Actinocrispum sp. NPDC049592 TaxID=3154835 RepID=UPI0034315869
MRLVMLCAAAGLLLTACSQPQAQPLPAPAPTTTVETTTATSTPSPEPQRAAPPAPPCGPEVRACVSLSQDLAWLMNNGVVEYGPVPTTHGRPGQETPVGTFKVAWKDAEHRSSIYGDNMPHSVFFAAGGVAFHEGSLTDQSHGCVHLSPEAAKIFFDSLPVKAIVQVVG